MAIPDNPSAAQPPPEPLELAPGTLIEGRYRVVRLIGVGGTGVVYEVEHLRTAQRLALKTLLDRAQAPRLEQEGRALAKLRSPHVVKVVDLGQATGEGASDIGPYLVMTLLEGKNLRNVLESKQKLPVPLVANIAVQVCEGLDEAHRAGLVHRDLKPDNIHLTDPPDPTKSHELVLATVFDFGVVKFAAQEPTNQLTRTGSTVGTPYYMSLEQLRGSGTVDAVSDVYAFSVVLYECFAGVRPFEAGTLGDLIYAICSTTPAHLGALRPDLPADIVDVVMRGLSREKSGRPQSMRELALAFEKYADQGFTVWLRVPAAAAPPPADVPPPPAPVAPAPVAPSASTSPPKTTTSTATGTNPQPRLMRPTERLARPVPAAPGRLPPRPGASGPPSRPPAAAGAPPNGPPLGPGLAGLALGSPGVAAPGQAGPAMPNPALLGPRLNDPTTSTDGSTPVDDADPPTGVAGPRDRETPTEMYVRDVHGDLVTSEVKPMPTLALAASPDGGPGPAGAFDLPKAPFANAFADPSTTMDPGDKTAVLDMLAVQQGPAASNHGGAFSPDAGASPEGARPAPSFGQPPIATGLSTSSPPNGIPASPMFPAPPSGMHGMASRASMSEISFRPAWQVKLDRALSGLGKSGNELGVRTLSRFRSASQEQQILIVVVVTASAAVLLVGLAYLVMF